MWLSKLLYNEFLNYGWFDASYSKDSKFVFNKETSMSKEYCKYETSDYSFVYQYFNVDEETKNFDKLSEMIKEYLDKALNLIKTFKSL